METPFALPRDDLDASVDASADDLRSLCGARVLVTGGTGFLGGWLVASLLHADRRLDLGLDVVLVSRHPEQVPIVSRERLTLARGDVRTFTTDGNFDVVVHGAASSSARFGVGDGLPMAMATTIVAGTERVLDIASRSSALVLFLSSGAVYGPQFAPVGEDVTSGPDPLDPRSAYGQAKRLAETLCAAAAANGSVSAVVARLFAFVGPRLPLDVHYAAGNFLGAALAGEPLRVHSDGRPQRSYLYAGDLPEWCWALLARGMSGRAYNVGSPISVSIAELAERVVAQCDERLPVETLGTSDGGAAPCYVPITDRAENELGLRPRVGLDLALRKSLDWLATRP